MNNKNLISVDQFEKEDIKNLVMNSLEAFADLGINLKSENAREAIAVKISTDFYEALREKPVSPSELIIKKSL